MTKQVEGNIDLRMYQPAIDKVLSWMTEWLSCDEYDRLAQDDKLMCLGSGSISLDGFCSPNTPIMPSALGNAGGVHADRICLLWCCEEANLIESKKIGNKMFYRAKKGR